MKLGIVCKGSTELGLGHLLRTRSFVQSIEHLHEVTVFASVGPGLESTFSETTADVRFFSHEHELVDLVGDLDILLFDLTHLDDWTFFKLKHRAKLIASISPVFNQAKHVNVFFTRNRNYTPMPGVKIFGGMEFAIFNHHCKPIDAETYERNLGSSDFPIAVCMGGGDAANKTLAVLEALVSIPVPCTIWVLLGEGYSHSYAQLVDTIRGNLRHEVVLAKTNRSMWNVMSNCVVGIMAGGLTAVEAIYAGLPTINLFDRKEHYEMLEELFDARVCLNGGVFSEGALGVLPKTLVALHHDRSRLREIRLRGQGVVDQNGSLRVLRILEDELAARSWPIERGAL